MPITVKKDNQKQAEVKKKLASQTNEVKQTLKSVEGDTITDLVEKEEFPLAKEVNWEDVSALPVFNEYNFSPIESLIKQYANCQELLEEELNKESPNNRFIVDINSLMLRISTSLSPYRYSKVELVTIENPNAPLIKIELENLHINETETIDITPSKE